MAIYLDDQIRGYLEYKFKEVKDSDFIGKRFQKMLKADRERLEEIGNCEHEAGVYKGSKTCCVKCGSNYEPGMSETWEIDENPK